MNLILDKSRLKISIIIFLVWVLAYLGTSFFNTLIKAPTYSIYIFSFENSIPYIPIFFPIYFLAIPITIAPLFIIKNKKLFDKTMKAYLITMILTGIIFLIFPTKISIPTLTSNYHGIVLFFHKIIPRYNLIPSFHMSLIFLSSFFIRTENKKIGNIFLVSSILVTISILLIKEHYLLDLIVGFILSLIIYKLISK